MSEANNIEVPVGEWVDIPAGMIPAVDTYVDSAGVLRSVGDDSCVVWHYKGCTKRGIHASEIVYAEDTNAPWCPTCWQKKRVTEVFSSGTK